MAIKGDGLWKKPLFSFSFCGWRPPGPWCHPPPHPFLHVPQAVGSGDGCRGRYGAWGGGTMSALGRQRALWPWKDTPNPVTLEEASTANAGHCLGMYPQRMAMCTTHPAWVACPTPTGWGGGGVRVDPGGGQPNTRRWAVNNGSPDFVLPPWVPTTWCRIFTGEGGVWGSYSLIFIPAPSSRGEEGFLSLFSLDQKRHGVSGRWVLLSCKAHFIVMRA